MCAKNAHQHCGYPSLQEQVKFLGDLIMGLIWPYLMPSRGSDMVKILLNVQGFGRLWTSLTALEIGWEVPHQKTDATSKIYEQLNLGLGVKIALVNK